ncbi:MAG: TatD family hydrolase [Thaumarchaeota archaeon]|nr:TatD family hydrolase [Nitrososphaerota archaeon]
MAAVLTPSILDAHVHLPAYPDPRDVVARARERGIKLLSVTVSPDEAALNLQLRDDNPSTVKCFVGVHPSEALLGGSRLAELEPFWEKADGIGEIGLDPKYSEVSGESAQMELFKAQIGAAERLGIPVEVHSRGAEETCLDVLEGYSLPAVLMHWFEGERLIGRVFSHPHYYVSFGPALLYSKKLLRTASGCPQERVLVESDGPVGYRPLGGADGPGLIPSVAFKLSEMWGMSFQDTLAQLSVNATGYIVQKG